MTEYEMPLLKLFTRLREAGLKLSIDEYKLVLQALQSGFGIPDHDALKRLCCTLWVKSAEEKLLFNYYFEQFIEEELLPLSYSEESVKSSSISEDQPNLNCHSIKLTTSKPIPYIGFLRGFIVISIIFISFGIYFNFNLNLTRNNNENLTVPEENNGVPNSSEGSDETLASIDDSKEPFNLLEGTSRRTNFTDQLWQIFWIFWIFAFILAIILDLFIGKGKKNNQNFADRRKGISNETSDKIIGTLTDDYLPISSRQMKQSWRCLRRLVRVGAVTELDVEETVKQISRQGFFVQPVLMPNRSNRTEILLLIDRDGSMIPFHALSNQLVNTALQSVSLVQTSVYYFHNCPAQFLYPNCHNKEADLIGNILSHLQSKYTGVLIVSDAGSVRGGINRERVKLTQIFLNQLRQQIRYIAWLNPMPRSRWQGTTASAIADLVHMFEFNHQGLVKAISVLRGKFTHDLRR